MYNQLIIDFIHPYSFLTMQSGIPVLCSSKFISLYIRKTWSNPHCFPETFIVSEHCSLGTIVGLYSVEDVDNSILRYSLEENPWITIHPLNGTLLVKGDIDYETLWNET